VLSISVLMTVRLRVRRRANWAAPRMGYKGWMDLQSGGCSAAPKMRGRRIALGRIGDRPRNGPAPEWFCSCSLSLGLWNP